MSALGKANKVFGKLILEQRGVEGLWIGRKQRDANQRFCLADVDSDQRIRIDGDGQRVGEHFRVIQRKSASAIENGSVLQQQSDAEGAHFAVRRKIEILDRRCGAICYSYGE